MDVNLKVSDQCRIAASKANQVLGMIRRNIYIYIGECVCVCVCVCVYPSKRIHVAVCGPIGTKFGTHM